MTSPRQLVAATVALGALFLPGCGGDGGGRMEVTVLFDSAVGVYETSDVLSLDASIGTVEDVELTGDHVRVVLSLRDDVPLPADVHATIEAQTVLGERNVTLFPSWSAELEAAGASRLADGDTIPLERTSVPVEPDEALQAFNELVASLDADVMGGLVTDSATILDGRGERIGASIDAATDLTETLEAIDGPMLEAASSLNQVASVLNQRDTQLRSLIDDFGVAVEVLAGEREQVQGLLSSLVDLSGEVTAILDVHGERLPPTIATLVAAMQVVETNRDTITVLADELPVVTESFEAAYKEDIGGFFLKVNTLAVVETVVIQLLDAVGLYPGEV
ncbi:MAG TPA: MCE family protein [Acidimicrobiales bacterium]|nr:MCE family protein [Acidimicrobiales bacterium]